jgi:hypothetical protein
MTGVVLRLFVGDDWASDHHDVEVMDSSGATLARARLPEGVAGMTRLHSMIASQAGDRAEEEDVQVLVGIKTDRGPWVQALTAAGYTVFGVNPLQAARYRQRHVVSGAKSDLLTELREGLWLVSGQIASRVATFPDHDHGRGSAAGSVAVGGAAARVA